MDVTSSYYAGADAIVLVYDTTARAMWEEVEGVPDSPTSENYADEIELCWRGSKDGKPKLLVASKIDDDDNRAVDMAVVKAYAQKNEMHLAEVSAKSGEGVEEMFSKLATLIQEAVAKSRNARSKSKQLAHASEKGRLASGVNILWQCP